MRLLGACVTLALTCLQELALEDSSCITKGKADEIRRALSQMLDARGAPANAVRCELPVTVTWLAWLV
jgi:hypothetical protein